MKILTPEVLISIFLFSAALFFIFPTSLSLVYCQLFPQHAQHLYFINGYSHSRYMCCNINTLMVKTHSPVVSEMCSFLRLRLEKQIAFRMLDIPQSSDRTGNGEDILWQTHGEETAQIAGRYKNIPSLEFFGFKKIFTYLGDKVTGYEDILTVYWCCRSFRRLKIQRL